MSTRSPAISEGRLAASRGPWRWRGLAAAPLVALGTVVAALLATHSVGVPLRDPDHNAALYVVLVGFAVTLLVGLDIVVRAARRTGTLRPPRTVLRHVRRERWTRRRSLAVGVALVSFYLTYMAYTNLKSIVPLMRPGALFDHQLAAFDRSMLGGADPAAALHSFFGTGLATQIFSTAYVGFIVFLPLSLALALVFSRELQASLFYATALSINWGLGAASYLLLPSLGPVYAHPADFSRLPASEAGHLQGVLMDQRVAFLHHPATATPQAIAAFASLHIAMSFTALLMAHVLGLGRKVKIALWTWLALTCTATVYLGWHYVIDDVAGLAIGATSLGLAYVLTGFDRRASLRLRTQPAT